MSNSFENIFKSRAEARAWLIEGGNPNQLDVNGNPLWFLAMQNKNEDVLDELISAGARLDNKTINGVGWVLACLDYNISIWMFSNGLKKIYRNDNWWMPDANDRHPFHDKRINAQMMGVLGSLWWSTGNKWSILTHHNKTPQETMREYGKDDILKIMNLWHQRIIFAGRRKIT